MKKPLSLLEEIELRPLTQLSEDEKWQLLSIRNEPEVRHAMFNSHEIGREEHAGWMAGLASNQGVEMFSFHYQGRLVGAIGLTEYDRRNSRANWAYYLTESCRGTGVGFAGEFKFLDLVFGELGLEKLNGEVLAFNTSVRALHAKFGFAEEGLRRKHIRRGDEWFDCVLVGITREDWLARRQQVLDDNFE